MSARIAIIGGGFCGTLAAVHLMRMHAGRGAELHLVERSEAPGRGLAYAPGSERWLLNVPAGAMSALPGDDHHFLRYARSRGVAAAPGSFLPRPLYGDYLQALLRDAVAEKPSSVRFSAVCAEATDIRPLGDGAVRVVLHDGRSLEVDAVVLATGHATPADPFPADGLVGEAGGLPAGNPRYVRNPWTPGALDAVDRRRPVLLVGTGLTMYDVALELAAGGHRASLHAVSRHGLLPRPHAAAAPDAARSLPLPLWEGAPAPRRLLRDFRRRVAVSPGGDWRALLASLRAETPALWAALPPSERARFLRHLRPFWEVHRHRAAPQVHAAVAELAAAGRLRAGAGRLVAVEPRAGEVAVTVLRPGGGAEVLRVGCIVNCTGPGAGVAGIPLLASLVRQGLATPDEHGLGLRTAPDYALVGRRGTPSRTLFYLGPLLRADHWESTAVPELRVHAARLAARLSAAGEHAPALAA
ncbi:MAG: FAD/NAD(P)-binding protein [Longimicrobiaceae bacterium]